jgi:hypothetical protein
VRVLRFLLRFLGWLLTPLVAWAASFIGAWLASMAVAGMPDPNDALVLTLAGGAVAAVSITFLWMRFLRRSPKVQEVLQVTAEGVPIVAVDEEEANADSKGVEEGQSESKSVNP